MIIRKLRAVEDAHRPTAKNDEWVSGKENPGLSPPVEYEVEGNLIDEPRVGESIYLYRTRRNNVMANGYFVTSAVVKLEKVPGKTIAHTRNSVYELVD